MLLNRLGLGEIDEDFINIFYFEIRSLNRIFFFFVRKKW